MYYGQEKVPIETRRSEIDSMHSDKNEKHQGRSSALQQALRTNKEYSLATRRGIEFRPSFLQSEYCLAGIQLMYCVRVPPSKAGEFIPSNHPDLSSHLLPPLLAAHIKCQAWLQWNKRVNINSGALRTVIQRYWEETKNGFLS